MAAVWGHLDAIRRQEIDKLLRRMPHLTPDRAAVEQLTRRLLAGLFGESADLGNGAAAAAARYLFGVESLEFRGRETASEKARPFRGSETAPAEGGQPMRSARIGEGGL
ncbi:MAG: hypothetical protein HY561_00655 [Gemmatimonadetes bacterium]|nr:hypothetical protein [Gemmatimonadota bacterium]